ncbi:MAG: MFS transporter [Burkholderiales bacterium]|nr:MFS transporter [Burkholderiales bacterium]
MKQENANIISAIPVIIIQFLSGFSESAVRSIIIIFIAFSVIDIAGLPQAPLVNIVNVFAIVPTLFLSSYSGKFADKYNKVLILRSLTWYQIAMALIVALCIYKQLMIPLLLVLLAIGFQQTVLCSVRFSILTEYFTTTKQISIATGCIEFAWFAASLTGQIFGSFTITSHKMFLFAIVILINSLICVGAGFILKPITKSSHISLPTKFYLNPFKDFWYMFKQVGQIPSIFLNMNATGWFWAFCSINTTQMSLFAANYLGVDGHIFGIILGIGTFGIGIGSILCAKLSRGVIQRKVVVISAIAASLATIVMLLLHPDIYLAKNTCRQFIFSVPGAILFSLILIKAIALGAYSLTCYTEAQVLAHNNNRSQVMSIISVVSAIYITIASGVCTLLQVTVSSWTILFITAIINIGLAIVYYYRIK